MGEIPPGPKRHEQQDQQGQERPADLIDSASSPDGRLLDPVITPRHAPIRLDLHPLFLSHDTRDNDLVCQPRTDPCGRNSRPHRKHLGHVLTDHTRVVRSPPWRLFPKSACSTACVYTPPDEIEDQNNGAESRPKVRSAHIRFRQSPARKSSSFVCQYKQL